MSQFFGLEVTSQEVSWIEASEDEPIAITNACLVTPARRSAARVAIQMCSDPEEEDASAALPVIGVLSGAAAGVENLKLELLINSKMGVKLVGADVAGAVVHLIGRHVPTDEESSGDEGDMGMGMNELDIDQLTEEQLRALAEATGNGDLNDLSSDDDGLDALLEDDSDDGDGKDREMMDDDDADDDDDDESKDDDDAVPRKGVKAEGATAEGAAHRKAERLAGRESDGGKALVAAKGGKIVTHPSGLKYQELLIGTGKSPTVGRNVAIRYTLRMESGKVVDKSGKTPFKFRLGIGEVIKGMDLGIEGMREGGSRHLIIVPKLAYGKQGSPPAIPRNATLFFDVELIKAWK
jgi:FKBP-type peptidyl-prolyl cis-trans isomerase